LWRGHHWLVRRRPEAEFSDAQCGFKALSREAAAQLLPLVEDDDWFSGCIGLVSVHADAQNTIYVSLDGVLFNMSQTELTLVPEAKPEA